jgi:hypothetical protein
MIGYKNSSAVESFVYFETTQVLEIKFAPHRGGGTKSYENVPLALVVAFRAADSKGRFYNQFIRSQHATGRAAYARVEVST